MCYHKTIARSLAAGLLCASLVLGTGCAVSDADSVAGSDVTATPEQAQSLDSASEASSSSQVVLADGAYDVEVTTDSSMFRAEKCTITAKDGTYTATLTLPGEGFSRLYWGTADEAGKASDDDIFDYYIDDEGKYTFDIPVKSLDEELAIAAFGHRRDRWYDHTIVFASPKTE